MWHFVAVENPANTEPNILQVPHGNTISPIEPQDTETAPSVTTISPHHLRCAATLCEALLTVMQAMDTPFP
jgi:hypothetical protein